MVSTPSRSRQATTISEPCIREPISGRAETGAFARGLTVFIFVSFSIIGVLCTKKTSCYRSVAGCSYKLFLVLSDFLTAAEEAKAYDADRANNKEANGVGLRSSRVGDRNVSLELGKRS